MTEPLIREHQPTLERLASFSGSRADDIARLVDEAWSIAGAGGAVEDVVTSVYREVIVRVSELEHRCRQPGAPDPGQAHAVEASRFENRSSPFADYFPEMPVSIDGLIDEAAAELRAVAADAVAALPFAERVVVVLRDVAAWDSAQVVELLQIDQERERILLHAGRARVRRALEQLAETRAQRDD